MARPIPLTVSIDPAASIKLTMSAYTPGSIITKVVPNGVVLPETFEVMARYSATKVGAVNVIKVTSFELAPEFTPFVVPVTNVANVDSYEEVA